MQTDTQSVQISVKPSHAFAFLSNPENLPRWAAAFAKEIHRNGTSWRVTTPQGDIDMRYDTDERFGIIDYHASPQPGVEVVFQSRIVPNPEGCVYVFTQHQQPGMPAEIFKGQVDSLSRELRLLKSLLEVGSCGT